MKSRTLLAAAVGGVLLVAGAFGAWTSASQGAAAPPGGDPATAALFELKVNGARVAVFSELIGISSGVDPADVELRGRRGGSELKLPGKRTPPTITLRRGVSSDLSLAAWHEQVMRGDVRAARKDVVVTAFDATGDPVARWNLDSAWPAKLEIDTLSAGSSKVMREQVTFVGEPLQRVAA